MRLRLAVAVVVLALLTSAPAHGHNLKRLKERRALAHELYASAAQDGRRADARHWTVRFRALRDRHVWARRHHRGIPSWGRAWLRGLRWCESTNQRYVHGAGGLYHSYYQFDLQTWGSVGGVGHPESVGLHEQSVRAWRLRLARGTDPWPRCG